MAANFPPTSLNLLTKLKAGGDQGVWQVSWKRFLELYHEPIEVIAWSCYRHHTGGQQPSSGFIEDAVANTVADFFARGQYGYSKTSGEGAMRKNCIAIATYFFLFLRAVRKNR